MFRFHSKEEESLEKVRQYHSRQKAFCYGLVNLILNKNPLNTAVSACLQARSILIILSSVASAFSCLRMPLSQLSILGSDIRTAKDVLILVMIVIQKS